MSDKSVSSEQRLGDLVPGPWAPINPLLPGWAVTSTTGVAGYAYARYRPDDNSVELLLSVFVTATVTAAQETDGYQWAIMPNADAAGNKLRPPQIGYVPVVTDRLQSTTPGSPRVHVNPGGAVTLFGISTSATFMRCACQRYMMDNLGL